MNVKLNCASCASTPLSHRVVSDVVVWVPPLLVHLMVVPAGMVTLCGENMKFEMPTSCVPPVGAHVGVAATVLVPVADATEVAVGGIEVAVDPPGVWVGSCGVGVDVGTNTVLVEVATVVFVRVAVVVRVAVAVALAVEAGVAVPVLVEVEVATATVGVAVPPPCGSAPGSVYARVPLRASVHIGSTSVLLEFTAMLL